MATKRPKFPETRAWVLCNNFNQRTTRVQMELRKWAAQKPTPQFTTWNQTSRRVYRYLFYRIREASRFKPKSVGIASPWNLRIQGLIRELRRRNGDYHRRWQRWIFQILELWHKTAAVPPNKRDPAWQTCAQILTSANHWRRRQPAASENAQTWTHVLWRAAHLNNRKSDKVPDSAWQVRYRIIVATHFRTRTLGWDRTHNRIVQNFTSNPMRQ